MTKIISVLLILILLCSCTVEIRNPKEENISSGDAAVSEDASLPEKEEPAEEKLSSDAPRYEAYQEEIILEYIENDAVSYNTRYEILEEKGLSAYIRNAELRDGWYFGAEMVITRDGDKIAFPIEGFYHYYDGISVPGTVFGTFAEFGEESIAFIGHKTVVVIDTENFERIEFSPELPDYGTDELWVNMVSHSEITKEWHLAVTPLDEKNPQETAPASHFLVFDEDGKLIFDKEIRKSLCGIFSLKDQNVLVSSPNFFSHIEFQKILGKGLVIIERFSNGGYFFDVETGDYYTYIDGIEVKKGAETLKTYNFHASENGYEDTKTAFFLLENGEIKDGFITDSDILGDFSYSYDERNINVDFSSDGKTVTVSDNFFGSFFKADFEYETCEVWYGIEEKHLKEKLAESPDGRTSLYNIGYTEGMDAAVFNVIQKDNETGRLTYLTDNGSIFGEIGYLKNGDCYVMTGESLEIFSPEGEKIFDLGEKLPLGYYENETQVRELLTFRRDPEDMSFIIVYYEGPKDMEQKDVSDEYGSRLGLGYTYRFGFLDAEGNLLESYDTGWEVWSEFYTDAEINMRYSEKELKIFVKTEAKFRGGFIGTFDMETHEFTVEPLEE
ncbi:MAG: hypothetical protein IJ300_12020 [Clostridia bacterium]|nr:hypothetical protein [Clostridia bacterium]MBQ8767377.1 hypothetical protein [Clostridia bacterium]